jgi:hypothetical protein
VIERTAAEVAKGAVYFDPDADEAAVLRFVTGDVADGNGEIVRRTLAAARVRPEGDIEPAPAASLFDVVPPTDHIQPPPGEPTPAAAQTDVDLVMWARQHLFEEVFQAAKAEREHVAAIQEDFLKRSFNSLIAQADVAIIAAEEEMDHGVHGAEGRLRKAEIVKEQHQERLRWRLAETQRGRNVMRGDVAVAGSALLLPLPVAVDGSVSEGQALSDAEIEQIAIRVARRYETGRGATVRSVEQEHIGFDLLSTRGLERRCIEVKGRAGVARVELTWSEFAKSQELGDDYWLYVVLDCGLAEPRLYRVQDPARALAGSWEPSLDVRFRIAPEPVIEASRGAPT